MLGDVKLNKDAMYVGIEVPRQLPERFLSIYCVASTVLITFFYYLFILPFFFDTPVHKIGLALFLGSWHILIFGPCMASFIQLASYS